jgi:hypothetical protein
MLLDDLFLGSRSDAGLRHIVVDALSAEGHG